MAPFYFAEGLGAFGIIAGAAFLLHIIWFPGHPTRFIIGMTGLSLVGMGVALLVIAATFAIGP